MHPVHSKRQRFGGSTTCGTLRNSGGHSPLESWSAHTLSSLQTCSASKEVKFKARCKAISRTTLFNRGALADLLMSDAKNTLCVTSHPDKPLHCRSHPTLEASQHHVTLPQGLRTCISYFCSSELFISPCPFQGNCGNWRCHLCLF